MDNEAPISQNPAAQNPTDYWANYEGPALASALEERRKSFQQFLVAKGFIARWRKAFGHYYGSSGDKSSMFVRPSGEQGELSVLVDAEYPSLVQHLVTMVCNQRLSFQSKAINTDTKSLTQTILANGILAYYLRKSGLETYLRRATESSLVVDWSWVTAEWETQDGKALTVDVTTGRPVMEGDVRYQHKLPTQVAYDVLVQDANDIPWIIVDELRSKYELATQFPDFKDEILARVPDRAYEAEYSLDLLNESTSALQSDMIQVCVFHHAVTGAVPTGRYALFLPGGSVLTATASPYDELPAVRISPAEVIGRSLGFSPTNHLMSLQDVIDAIVSACVTNVTSLGINSIWAEPGHNMTVQELANGMALFESKTKPEPLNFSEFPPVVIELLKFIIGRAEAISGVNSTVRGQPPPDSSGAAMALLVSQALTFNSGLQAAFALLTERVGQLTLSHLQKFPTSKRLTAIAGQSNQWMMKEWAKDEIGLVTRVFVDVGNPLSNSVSGRMTLADSLMKIPPQDRQQYMQLLETGTLEPAMEGPERQLLMLREENERLQQGQPVKVILIENHKVHIDTHSTVLTSPDAKDDPTIVQNTLDHIQQHINAWKSAPPELLAALGIPPFPQMMPPPGALPPGAPPPGAHPPGPPGPMPPHPPGPPGPPPGMAPKVLNAENPIAQAGAKVAGPALPKVAGTHERFQPPGGPQALPPGVRR